MPAYFEPVNPGAATLPITGETVLIGARPECDLRIADPTVSGRHAVLQKLKDSWLLKDVGSTNGTWVNGRVIKRTTEINTGDHIAFGGACYFFNDGTGRPIAMPENLSPLGQSADHRTHGVIDRLLALPPYDFEKLLQALFARLAFDSVVTQQSADGGIDVVATNRGVIFRGKYLIQCKRYNPKHKVSRPEVVGFFGRVAAEPGAKGIFVTTSTFTKGASGFAQSVGINLIGGEDLEHLVLRHRLL